MRLSTLGGVAVALAAAVAPVRAAPASLRIVDGWVRATPPGAPTAAAYLTVVNPGPTADRLTGVATADAARAELHTMDMTGGVMRMRPLTEGAAVPAGGRLDLQPGGGLHIMLVAPRRQLVNGDRITAALTFAGAGRRSVTLPVRATPPTGHGVHAP